MKKVLRLIVFVYIASVANGRLLTASVGSRFATQFGKKAFRPMQRTFGQRRLGTHPHYFKNLYQRSFVKKTPSGPTLWQNIKRFKSGVKPPTFYSKFTDSTKKRTEAIRQKIASLKATEEKVGTLYYLKGRLQAYAKLFKNNSLLLPYLLPKFRLIIKGLGIIASKVSLRTIASRRGLWAIVSGIGTYFGFSNHIDYKDEKIIRLKFNQNIFQKLKDKIDAISDVDEKEKAEEILSSINWRAGFEQALYDLKVQTMKDISHAEYETERIISDLQQWSDFALEVAQADHDRLTARINLMIRRKKSGIKKIKPEESMITSDIKEGLAEAMKLQYKSFSTDEIYDKLSSTESTDISIEKLVYFKIIALDKRDKEFAKINDLTSLDNYHEKIIKKFNEINKISTDLDQEMSFFATQLSKESLTLPQTEISPEEYNQITDASAETLANILAKCIKTSALYRLAIEKLNDKIKILREESTKKASLMLSPANFETASV